MRSTVRSKASLRRPYLGQGPLGDRFLIGGEDAAAGERASIGCSEKAGAGRKRARAVSEKIPSSSA
jgi:hypothetical protein